MRSNMSCEYTDVKGRCDGSLALKLNARSDLEKKFLYQLVTGKTHVTGFWNVQMSYDASERRSLSMGFGYPGGSFLLNLEANMEIAEERRFLKQLITGEVVISIFEDIVMGPDETCLSVKVIFRIPQP